MKVFECTLIFSFLFYGLTGSIYGQTPESKVNLQEDTLLRSSLLDAQERSPESPGSSPLKGAGSSEWDHIPHKENEVGPIPLMLLSILNSDPGNKAPKAHAGNYKDQKDEDGNGIEAVQLDGSQSKDEDGEIVSYRWTIEGTDIELATGVSPTVDFPLGSTWIVLTVTDDGGLTDSQKVKIRINEGDANLAAQGDGDDDEKGKEDKKDDDKGKDDDDKEDQEKDDDKGKDDDDDKGKDDDDEKDKENKEEPNNKAPVADAGKDQQLKDADKDGKETVKLDGSKSRDEDGRIETYSWSMGGTEIATGVNPSINLEVGTHIVQLTVTDDKGLTARDEVEIRISAPANQAPEAHAGPDQEKTDTDRDGKESVVLDGSGSKDLDGRIEEYSWKVNGAEIATGVKPSVELATGTTTVVLTVTDDEGVSASDEVIILIKEGEPEEEEPANIAPTADAGESQIFTVEKGVRAVEVKLDGSGSTDADGEIVSYSWSLAGAEIATGKEPTVPLSIGVHIITLTVTDNDGSSDTDEVEIKVNLVENDEEEEEPTNVAPVAHAGADQELKDTDGNGKEIVQLNGTGSTDEDGRIVSYSWSLEGSETVLATGINPTVELPLGSTTIVLRVTDDGGLTSADTVEILIKEGEEKEETEGENGEVPGTGEEPGTGEVPEDGEEAEGEEEGEEDPGNGEVPEDGEEGEEETDGDGETGGEAGTAFLPNLFSPNGDQMNDEFTLEATHVEKVHLRIYNRQGRLVYETRDVMEATEIGWDGNSFGEAQPAGSYVWILEGSYTDGSPILIEGDIKGNVTLIR